jgi:uncharacterized Ntn-hydrolase superfamily protein
MTYSIVARDPSSGWLGVAVQSHYFGTGRVVTWAEAGVGAVATQSVPELAYGARGLERMRSGSSAPEALASLLAEDPQRALRQVGMVDTRGNVAAHTGEQCIAEAGHATGAQVSVQANLMEYPTVWGAMLRAYEKAASEPFPYRLLAALDAAEHEGGDLRGRQSAAMMVVSAARGDAPWRERLVDLRVDDHPDPLGELRRLLGVHVAFERLAQIFVSGILFGPLSADSRALAHALGELEATQAALEPNREPTFWQAVLLAKAGRIAEARGKLARACETNSRWSSLLERLVPSGILSPDTPLLAALRR